ncbi:MAG: 30S ribosomal protein S17 [Caldilineaceae bacterium]|jgi:small subunit ribosomal protein S17|nr:30S ribosomal protein S17 [Caldilineaceae bacterium]MCY4521988.1 30S ribosomal protein S17 [Caldilineaceae bacterium]
MRERRKVLSGTVVQDSMDKTVSVRVERTKRHPLYGKIIRTYKRYQVHDEDNQARMGDSVRIRQCRPVSRRKHFFVEEVTARAHAPDEVEV